MAEGQLSTKGELQKQGGTQSAPGASMHSVPSLDPGQGRGLVRHAFENHHSRRQLGSNLSHAVPVKGGEVVPEFYAIEELTSLKKLEMECYLGVCHILPVHPQPKPLY